MGIAEIRWAGLTHIVNHGSKVSNYILCLPVLMHTHGLVFLWKCQMPVSINFSFVTT